MLSGDLLTVFMKYYAIVFHPLAFLFAVSLLIIRYEGNRQDVDWPSLWTRVLTFVGITTLALIPDVIYVLFFTPGTNMILLGNSWQIDFLTGLSLFIAASIAYYTWHINRWGPVFEGAVVILAVVAVPHVLISPFWNFSGHVAFSMMPALYVTLVDRKFWPLLIVPTLMVANRPLLGAHTWSQSVAAYIVAGVLTYATYELIDRRNIGHSTMHRDFG